MCSTNSRREHRTLSRRRLDRVVSDRPYMGVRALERKLNRAVHVLGDRAISEIVKRHDG